MEDLQILNADAFDDDPVEPPFSGELADTISGMVDTVAALERSKAKLVAWQLEQIDEARRLAETTEHSVLTVGSTLSASQRREMARRSLVAELACALVLPETTVLGMLADGEALLHRLPATMTALRAGEISYRHARVIVDQTQTLNPDAAVALEEQALPFARALTVAKFTVKARLLRERLDPESITVRVAKSVMAWLSLFTTAPEATSLFTAVRDRAIALQKTPAEARTLTQLTADVCTDALAAALSGDLPAAHADSANVEAATGATTATTGPSAGRPSTIGSGSAFSRITPTVVVTVPALTLLGWGNEPGSLSGYGPVPPETARMLAGQSRTWYRMLTDPKTGAPIAVDSTKYRPTKSMRRYLEYINGTCQFTGCNRAARHCDLDHTTDHAFGGPTECTNLSHLCPKHHRLKHQTTWRVKQLGVGTLEWTSPGGRSYLTQPDVLLAVTDPPDPEAPDPPTPDAQTAERFPDPPGPPPNNIPPFWDDIPPF